MNRDFTQAGFLSPCDAFKKQSVFLLNLLRKKDKPNNNDHAFACHFFLDVLGVKIRVLWGIQYSAFPPNFSSNHSLFLMPCEVGFHLLWPALQLITLSAFRVSPHLCLQDAQRDFLKSIR